MNSQANLTPPDKSSHSPARFSRRKSIIGGVIALLLLAGLGWLAWHFTRPDVSGENQASGTSGRPGPGGPGGRFGPTTTVGVAKAEQVDIPVVLDALGTVTATSTATVRAQVSGVLQKVLFTEGQMVKTGQVLATIDPRPFEMNLLQATGQRQRDEAQLENARLTLQRFKTLLEQDSIARQEVDTQAALVKQLEGTVKTDKAAEGTAKLNLGYTRITAPIDGRVGLRNADVGNIVSTGDASGIAVITPLTPIDVLFSISQDRVPELRERISSSAKLPVTVYDRSRTRILDTGTFLALDNQVDTQTGTVRAKARFANAKLALFPSQFVNVRLEIQSLQGVVAIPVSAVRHGNEGDFVYVLNPAERTVSARKVAVGQATVDKVQIVSGLKAGEQVITEGGDRLKDGAKVNLPGDKPGVRQGNGGKRRGQGGPREGGPRQENASGAPQSADGTAATQENTRGAEGGSPSGQNPSGAGPAQGDATQQREGQQRRRPEGAQQSGQETGSGQGERPRRQPAESSRQ
jgi:multidrug efflux system membrane fusion protein